MPVSWWIVEGSWIFPYFILLTMFLLPELPRFSFLVFVLFLLENSLEPFLGQVCRWYILCILILSETLGFLLVFEGLQNSGPSPLLGAHEQCATSLRPWRSQPRSLLSLKWHLRRRFLPICFRLLTFVFSFQKYNYDACLCALCCMCSLWILLSF